MKARIPKRFYGGNPRRLRVPEKSIKTCSMDGTRFTGASNTCSRACAEFQANHESLLDLIGGGAK